MKISAWWQNEPLERYWMEITGRPDLGADLHAPRLDDAGGETPSYSLVREVRNGDVVFHYEKALGAITAWSVAHGGFWEAETIWGTPRSTGPTGTAVSPYPREGLWHGLHGPFYLDEPLTRGDLQELEGSITEVVAKLEAEHGKPLYLPFQLRADGLRAAQGYLTKMPADLVAVLPKLPDLLDDLPAGLLAPPSGSKRDEAGQKYRVVEVGPQVDRDPFSVDPAVVERALRSHGDLQNQLAALVAEAGFEPRSPGPLDQPWDLLWLNGDQAWVAEVKSLTRGNEERQLRLGLGQVLIYRQRLLRQYAEVEPVLMVEWAPVDSDWQVLCESLGVRLLWPAVAPAGLLAST